MADKVVIEFDAEVKRLQKELNGVKKQLGIIDKEAEEANKEIGNMDKQAPKLSSSFKKLGGVIAAAFSIAVIKQFISESIRLADIQLKAEAQLLTALKGRKGVQQSLIKQASELQSLTIFGDEEIIKAQSLIAAFTKEEEQIKSLTEVTLDFASAKGVDLNTAADLLTKTFASSTNALSRYGIEVEGAAGSAERLESLTTALTDAFGGQAQTLAQTGAGGLQQLNNIIGDIKENFGIFFLQTFNPLVRGMSELAAKLAESTKEVTKQSQEVNKAKFQFNAYVEALKEGNLSEDTRIGLIRTINKEYGEYLPKLIDEKATIEDIAKAQQDANAAFNQRITLLAVEEDLVEIQKQIIDNTKERIQLELNLALAQQKTATNQQDALNSLAGVDQAATDASIKVFELTKKLEQNADESNSLASEYQLILQIANQFGVTTSNVTSDIDQQTTAVNDLNRSLNTLLPTIQAVNASTIDGTDAIQDYINTLETLEVPELDLQEKGFFGFTEDQKDQSIALAAQTFGEINNIAQIAGEHRQQALKAQLDKGLISEKEYERKLADLKTRQARADKANALFQIGINTAVQVSKNLGSPLVPFIIALGAAQAAAVLSRPLPKFEKGGEIGGNLHSQGGTIIEAERGEYVVNRRAYAQNKEAVEAINTNRFHEYIMKQMHSKAMSDRMGISYDDSALIHAVRRNGKVAIKNEDALARKIGREISRNKYFEA